MENPRNMDDDTLFFELGQHFPHEGEHVRLHAEILRRQWNTQLDAIKAQKDAAVAQQEAASAAITTARLTAENVRWMFWAVMVAGAAVVVAALDAIF